MKTIVRKERGWFPFQIPSGDVAPPAHRLVRNTLLLCRDAQAHSCVAVIVATVGGAYDSSLAKNSSKTYRTQASICNLPDGVEITDRMPETLFLNEIEKYSIDLGEDCAALVLSDHEEFIGGNVQHDYAVDLVGEKLLAGEVKPKELCLFTPGSVGIQTEGQSAYSW